MANGKVLKGPYWTRNWIEAMWRFTNENFVDFDTGAVDYEALGKEEFQFRKALFFRNFKNSERAKMAFASAEDDYKNPVENGKKGGRPKKSPQDAPNGNAGVDMSDARNGAASKSPTSCDTFTADGDTREDSQDRKSGTSANNSGNGGSGTSQARESRRTGAGSLRSDCHSAPVRLPSFDEFTAFIDAQGLDYTDAREWWEMTMVDRDGKDRYGKPIGNWKVTCRRFCEAKANKRKTAK